jgi:hypothetical protein
MDDKVRDDRGNEKRNEPMQLGRKRSERRQASIDVPLECCERSTLVSPTRILTFLINRAYTKK